MKDKYSGLLKFLIPFLVIVIAVWYFVPQTEKEQPMPEYVLVIHGGAGTILPENMSAEREAAYREALGQALAAGEEVLKAGGASLDAVSAAILVMEDSPLFNAGKGAVFNAEGVNELDAAIMDGATLNAGAVSGVQRIANPVLLARAVMDNSGHVMLVGKGAEDFAQEQGFEFVEPDYFYTDYRWGQLQKAKEAGAVILESDDDLIFLNEDHKYGTVGAVALDAEGNLAAATSTGGLTNKRYGRVGDTPIIGAGTYADNNSCAVSGTGTGEYFIRATVARNICALMEYQGLSLEEAAEVMVHEVLIKMGGDGGIISVDAAGNIALKFNTTGMYRGYVIAGGDPVIGIYKD
jgi:beta-aspartyl-peptidase (threonine type)